MKKNPLNHLLLETFPPLESRYQTYKGGTFDLDTPAVSFYEEIFVSYLIERVEVNDLAEVNKCFDFIEMLMSEEDEMYNDVAIKGILIPLYESENIDLEKCPLGTKSFEYYKTWLVQSN